MSNEIQLALNQGYGQGLPTAFAPGGGALGAAGGGQATPLKVVHRLLRGRYILAAILATVCAVACAAAGFLVAKPAYKSISTLQIDPTIPLPGEPIEKVMVMQGLYIQSQMIKLKDERVLMAAMEDPRWKAVAPKAHPFTLEKFATALSVDQPPKATNFIVVSFVDNGKEAKNIVQPAVASVVKAFKEIYGQEDMKVTDDKIIYMQSQIAMLERETLALRQDNDVLGKDGADDEQVIRAYDDQAILTQRTLNDVRELYNQNKQEREQAEQAGGGKKFTVEDFARVDPEMAGQVRARAEDQMRYDTLLASLGPNNPAVLNAARALNARIARAQKYADDLNDKFVIRWRPDGGGGALIGKDTSVQEGSIRRLEEMYDRQAKQVADMRGRAKKISQNLNLINQYQGRLKEMNDSLRVQQYVRDHVVHTKYLMEEGTQATLDKDRRPVMAALGFMGGAGLPIGVMLLIGMFDSRYRYSDETNAEMRGMTLLGILPNLPDRLSDPEQAGIAAHCVHQIRTMLQINGAPQERRVFAVTSASPGDGKTSLTLALGLSYAACGTRTLLIDCDLIGAGLTARMNVSAAEGVLEAIASRQLLPYVRKTDIADVAILPVGSAGTLHASTLSPNALRRLIEEAEKHFETVLIDTGPVLGSIEASLVCAAADAVVLTVSRGQQRPMVEKSLSHLTAIGARLAGVVFNRAQAQDFERSISGVSMRSVGVPNASRSRATQVEQAARLNAIARAVTAEEAGVGVGDDDEDEADQD